MSEKILVTGGCGFIGSHTVLDLLEKGFEVVSMDDFSNSHREVVAAVSRISERNFLNLEVDLTNRSATFKAMEESGPFTAIIHFAAYKSVGESVKHPFKYYQNNIRSLLNVAECAVKLGVRHFVFSSSCTVYGNPREVPVTEKSPILPAVSPYGMTKQIGESLLCDIGRNTKEAFQSVLLRYFNPAGAHESGKLGEASLTPSTNLVPIICEVASGKRDKLVVYGDDYQTRDGSCVRDYIHVMDLAEAHTLALRYSMENSFTEGVEVFNLGIGQGVTVLEAIRSFEKVTGKKVRHQIGSRRPGDVPAIYAEFDKASKLLNWQPQRSIEDIVQTAWEWEKVRF